MKAISLHQPWASMMAIGAKQNETRGRRTHYRGDLLICATRKGVIEVSSEMLNIILKKSPELFGGDIQTVVSGFASRPDGSFLFPFPMGMAVCIVEVFDCISTEQAIDALVHRGTDEFHLGGYGPRRWVWRTRNLRRLVTPFEVRGYQGFFEVDDVLVANAMVNGNAFAA